MSWPRRWDALWIWWFPEGQHPEPPWDQGEVRQWSRESWVTLRRTFTLDDVPSDARCRITADGRYRLWINGEPIGRGPVRSEPAHLTYDEYEMPLRAGENVVAILARWYGRPTVWWKPAPRVGELGLGGVLFESTVGISSDASWRARPAPYRVAHEITSDGPPDPEAVVASDDAWTRPGFDDEDWDGAAELDPRALGVLHVEPPTEPFGALESRPIAMLAERVVQPATQIVHDERRLVVDFGQILNAHVRVATRSAVELTCGEDLAGDMVVAEPRNWTMTVRGIGEVEAFEPVGFRYLEVRGQDVGAVRVSAVERTYPRDARASFRCSDPVLDEIWEAGARTLDLCSTDAFLDCPGREQRAWLGDGYLHTLLTFVLSDDARLARWNLLLHGRGARPDGFLPQVAAGDFGMRPVTLPDNAALWVMGLARYFEHTADTALLEELLPVAARALNAFERYRDDDGLITDLPGWVFIDWAQLERGPKQAAVDAELAMALDDFARMSDAMGDEGSAARARARADRTREAFERYWDSERGVYLDTIGGRRVSQQTNSVAMLCGAAPRERWDGIFEQILDPERITLTRTPGDPGSFAERIGAQFLDPMMDDEEGVVLSQPFYAHFLHQALARAGRYDDLLRSIRRWHQMLSLGNGCFGEYWDHTPGLGSRAHAWSATPTFDLTRHILGVRHDGTVEPQLGGLDWAEGVLPTRVGWKRVRVEAGGQVTVARI